jgi:hypothetical protein
MIPQEKGLQGINVYFLFSLPFLSKGGDRLRELLGEGQQVLDSTQKYLNPSLV